MKILFVSPIGLKIAADYKSEYQMGAIEQQIFGLAKELSSRGCKVFIMRSWTSSKEMETIGGVKVININVPATQRRFHERLSFITLPVVFIEHLFFSVKAYKRLREINPDVVNISTLFTGYFIIKLNMANSRKVFIIHSPLPIFLGTGIVRTRIKRKMIESVINSSDKVVTLNEGMRNYLYERGFRTDAIIPNAMSLKGLKNGGEGGFILYAGRLVPHKRVDDLIKAYSEISGDFKEELVVIGSGPCEKKLKSYAISLGLEKRVRFVPFLPRSKYRSYLSKCRIFILPSAAEAFGVVIIEAMACGKPVIARKIIGPEDIIIHGHNGFLFENSDELKKYLQLLLSDEKLRKKLGSNARRTVETKYTFRRIADSYETLYRSLLTE